MNIITSVEFNLIRQWFESVQDINPVYLTKEDYQLAVKVYENCGHPIPESVVENV